MCQAPYRGHIYGAHLLALLVHNGEDFRAAAEKLSQGIPQAVAGVQRGGSARAG